MIENFGAPKTPDKKKLRVTGSVAHEHRLGINDEPKDPGPSNKPEKERMKKMYEELCSSPAGKVCQIIFSEREEGIMEMRKILATKGLLKATDLNVENFTGEKHTNCSFQSLQPIIQEAVEDILHTDGNKFSRTSKRIDNFLKEYMRITEDTRAAA
jgi:hypothetical protein